MANTNILATVLDGQRRSNQANVQGNAALAAAALEAAQRSQSVPSGYMAAGRAAQSGSSGGVAVGPTSTLGQKTGNATISSTNKGGGSGGSGGSRATYIGSDGAKKSGTVKVTPGTTPKFYDEMAELYRQMYADSIAADEEALAAAEQRTQEATDEQLAALAAQYAGTNRQLYRDYMNTRKTLPQQLAAMGYNGGASESSLLRLGTSYEEGLNENERAKAAQEAGLRSQLAQKLYELRAKSSDSRRASKENLDSRLAALKEAAYQNQMQRAAEMAANGDFSEYALLGYSPSEIAWLKQMFSKKYPALA